MLIKPTYTLVPQKDRHVEAVLAAPFADRSCMPVYRDLGQGDSAAPELERHDAYSGDLLRELYQLWLSNPQHLQELGSQAKKFKLAKWAKPTKHRFLIWAKVFNYTICTDGARGSVQNTYLRGC